jgi:hypothetical protein
MKYGKSILMAIADKEVTVECSKIQVHMPDTMSSIDAAQDPQLLAYARELIEGHPYPRLAHNGVKHCDSDIPSATLLLLDRISEGLNQPFVRDGISIVDRDRFDRRCLDQVINREFACSVYGREVNDHITRLEDETSQNRIDPCRGVGNKDYRIDTPAMASRDLSRYFG